MSEDMRSDTAGMSTTGPRFSPVIDSEGTREQGVGGRHRETALPAGGGGYLDNCTTLDPLLKGGEKIDPRIDELHRIGLHARWLAVAKLIGYEKFVEVWSVLDESLDEESRRGFTIHNFRELKRYQRNRYIEDLSLSHKAAEIQRRVKKDLGEDLSKRQVARLMKAQGVSV